MSRFEKFQNIRVLNEKKEPLNEQIYVHDCIINFEDGFIHNKYNSSENEMAAIECIDAHAEYWENGVLNKDGEPAVISVNDDIIEFWENGKKLEKNKFPPKYTLKENSEIGNEAETNFAKYLNEKNVPFIHLDQPNNELYSKALSDKKIKRPDYIIFIDKTPIFVDVKALGCYTLNKNELKRLNNLKNEFSINVIFAIKDKNENDFNKYSFLTLDNITNYVEIFKENLNLKCEIYPIPKTLLNIEIVFDEINDDELKIIFKKEKAQYIKNKYRYSDILEEYFKNKNYNFVKDGQAAQA
jgi:hypothetical protein